MAWLSLCILGHVKALAFNSSALRSATLGSLVGALVRVCVPLKPILSSLSLP